MGHRTPKPRPKMSGYITPEGYERYRAELTFLWEDERPKVTQGVADAAAEGDRSENAEYIYGKKRLRAIDRRIRFLTKRLDEVKVVQSGTRASADTIYFGAWVRIEDDEGELAEYRIVGPDEHDMHPQYVSMDAPMGRALLGKRLDDEVLLVRPKGNIVLTVLHVQYEPFS